jgi:hypothetical protein
MENSPFDIALPTPWKIELPVHTNDSVRYANIGKLHAGERGAA